MDELYRISGLGIFDERTYGRHDIVCHSRIDIGLSTLQETLGSRRVSCFGHSMSLYRVLIYDASPKTEPLLLSSSYSSFYQIYLVRRTDRLTVELTIGIWPDQEAIHKSRYSSNQYFDVEL